MGKKHALNISIVCLLTFLITSCNFPDATVTFPTMSEDPVYTQAAQTIEATLTQGALSSGEQPTQAPIVTDIPSSPEIPTATLIQPTATNSTTPTSILPTSTPSALPTIPIPTLTLTSLPIITSTPSVPMIHATRNTNCRMGPGPEYDVTGFLMIGDLVEVRGRNPTATWWQIQNPDYLTKLCWVWSETTVVSGNLSMIPVITPSPTPTPDTVIITLSSVADPVKYTGPCPVNIDLMGKITTNLPTKVTFRWAANFSYPFTPDNFTFDVPGSQKFYETMTINSSTVGYVRFRVYEPYEVKADRIEIKITCSP